MANRERGELRLVACDRSYTLRLTVAACCDLEDQSGGHLRDLLAQVNLGQARAVRWLLWAALQAYHRDQARTLVDVGRIVDAAGGLRRVLRTVSAFMALNQDDDPELTTSTTGATEAPANRWRRLYIDARRAGLAPETFWGLSLRELWRELSAQQQQREAEWRRDRALAWDTAALTRAEKMPTREKFVGTRKAPAGPQSWKDMKAAMNAVMAASTQEH